MEKQRLFAAGVESQAAGGGILILPFRGIRCQGRSRGAGFQPVSRPYAPACRLNFSVSAPSGYAVRPSGCGCAIRVVFPQSFQGSPQRVVHHEPRETQLCGSRMGGERSRRADSLIWLSSGPWPGQNRKWESILIGRGGRRSGLRIPMIRCCPRRPPEEDSAFSLLRRTQGGAVPGSQHLRRNRRLPWVPSSAGREAQPASELSLASRALMSGAGETEEVQKGQPAGRLAGLRQPEPAEVH